MSYTSISSGGRSRGIPTSLRLPYGIYFSVSGSQARVPVTFVDYGDESDSGFNGETGYPIPECQTTAHYIGVMHLGAALAAMIMIIIDRDRWISSSCIRRTGTDRGAAGGAGSGDDLRPVSTNGRRRKAGRLRMPLVAFILSRTGALRRNDGRHHQACISDYRAATNGTSGRRHIELKIPGGAPPCWRPPSPGRRRKDLSSYPAYIWKHLPGVRRTD